MIKTKPNRIAILLDSARRYDRDVLKGIIDFSRQMGHWSTYHLPPDYIHGHDMDKIIENIIKWSPDGVITRTFTGWEQFKALGVPLILSPYKKIIENEISFHSDDREIGRMAADYFMALGFENFAFIGNSDYHWSDERQKAFKKEVKSRGLFYKKAPEFIKKRSWYEIPELLAEWLSVQPKPLALFAACDEFSSLANRAIEISGYHCPSQIALLGCDNDVHICELAEPQISSIGMNAIGAGFEVAKRMHGLIRGEQLGSGNIVTLPEGVITRKSTDIVAVKDIELQKAVRFIIENAPIKNIRVSDVVKITSLSRRLLEMRFKKELGLSVLHVIKKYRISHFKKLLNDKSIRVKDIYAVMDFSNQESVSRYFKNETGMTPSEYREKFKK
ncbi:DNA-binding transcriptional regulator [Zobellia uliginosa]|uniref:DNA-binding transcriptional regulator n=1 Tax=Zobellia uliginosa TaxID=143224 RepID=UPI0026E28BA5|nr:DNA-binding transcriptional regulator [Zobellia uliginosa]MDO6517757.1 DNA-binding transcriptional regulator [Zobellia uliginosa]